jgi:hypothetical protein
LPDDIRTLLTKALEWKSVKERDAILDNISDTIKEGGNTTDDDIKEYLEEFANEQNMLERNKELIERKATFDKLASSLEGIDWTWKNYNSVLERIKALKTLELNEDFDNEVRAILQELENPQTLLSISLDLQTQDQKNGTRNFEAFKSAVINLDPRFRDRFAQAETNAKLALWTDNLHNTTITDKGYKQAGKDGFTTSATLDGKDRAISRTDSNYSLKSNIDSTTVQKEVEKLTNDLAEALKPIDKELVESDNSLVRFVDNYLGRWGSNEGTVGAVVAASPAAPGGRGFSRLLKNLLMPSAIVCWRW